jgi:cold shock CspA family protein
VRHTERIDGITISLRQNEERKPVDADGYVGILTTGTALIEVHIEPNVRICGLNIDGRKNVVLKKNLAPLTKPPSEGKFYQTKTQVVMDIEGIRCTKYPDNYMGLLELTEEGQLKFWEIALVSQLGYFFLTVQQIYRTDCYHDGERIVCPFFEGKPHKWPQLVQLSVQLLTEMQNKLKPISEYRSEPEPAVYDLDPNKGRVLWWNRAQGLGAIVTSEGEARVHWKGIKQTRLRSRLAFLTAGEIVQYQSLRPTPIPPFKERRTSFKWEAVDVEPLI